MTRPPQLRRRKGTPTGGQFAATNRAGATVELTDDASEGDDVRAELLADLEQYGDIPAPLPEQSYRDVQDRTIAITADTFADAYVDYFRGAVEHARTGAPFGDDMDEAAVLAVAGLEGANLGRHRSTWIERGRDGEPVIVAHTRNGGGNREHWDDETEPGFDCGCTGCVQTYGIPSLPTYLHDEDDDGDSTYANVYFRPKDEAARKAAEAYLRARDIRGRTLQLKAIREDKEPPWSILSPRRDAASMWRLNQDRQQARRRLDDARRSHDRLTAVVDAVTKREPLPEAERWARPSEAEYTYEAAYSGYTGRLEKLAAVEGQLDRLHRDAAIAGHLPKSIEALVAAERERLTSQRDRAKTEIRASEEAFEKCATALSRELGYKIRAVTENERALAKAEEKIESHRWAQSWPGDPHTCPARPEAVVA